MTLFVMSFYYNDNGDNMTIYLDLVFFLNLFFDFILLLSVSLLLKRNIKLYNVLFGSLIGSLSIFLLFIDLNNIELFIFKFIISILMTVTTFGYKDILYTIKNIIYLYFVSIFLGGFLYLINDSFDYHNGLVFYNNGLSINIIIILVLTPILVYVYLKGFKHIKNNYHNYYNISLYIKDKIINVTSYLDTGNKLESPYTHTPVILLHNKDPIFNNLKYTLIPYNTVSSNGLIKCYKVDKIHIEGVGDRYKVIVGIMENEINIDGVDCILNTKLLEGK